MASQFFERAVDMFWSCFNPCVSCSLRMHTLLSAAWCTKFWRRSAARKWETQWTSERVKRRADEPTENGGKSIHQSSLSLSVLLFSVFLSWVSCYICTERRNWQPQLKLAVQLARRCRTAAVRPHLGLLFTASDSSPAPFWLWKLAFSGVNSTNWPQVT